MHVPDGFLNAPVSVATGAVAAAAVAVSLRGARRELAGAADHHGAERTAPLAGLVAAFVFAVQMLNFPVGAGTSGHLMGGALAAILVGPYTGVLALSVVLLMQALLFADGGLTALGTNITLIGVVTVVVSYAVFRALVRVLPRRRGSVTAAAFVSALLSVPAAAAVFTGLYVLGGTAEVPLGKVLTAMLGVHTLIGVGEALITTATVGAVLAVRPDLVYAARGLARPLVLRSGPVATPGSGPVPRATTTAATTSTAAGPAAAPAPAARPASTRKVWAGGLAATLLCAGVVSFYASAAPDGLEKVAGEYGISSQEEEHGLADSPLADYGIASVTDERLSGGLAGVIGAGTTLVAGTGVLVVVTRRRNARAAAEAAPAPAADGSTGRAGGGDAGRTPAGNA
ncbi:energy-coupling factor ABC transporter permease [Streptomyces verrucosisporus]|uniref:energy-coupling factor ABC transporter permease n=1 Tax=Streptomyces verrucosisporus TaxID=1695161 RepID=UPI0019D11D72|nr:energy-coupling factor ABC transporter permease [Streptomyces verrucosisporus]MBN3929000.1 energy-coupling factor ABC transporter permease [Streptomyces verrucosisporus]